MNQKGFLNPTFFIAIAVVGFVIVGYFVLQRGQNGSSVKTPSLATPTPSIPTSVTNEWKIFQDSRYTFRFEYPAKWSIENQQGTARVFIIKNEQREEIITIDTEVNLAVIGISYCGAYPQDNRCEILKTDDDSAVIIDWGVDGKANAMFSSPNGTHGVSFTLHKINSDTKSIFRKILSTFKFLK